MTLTPNRKAWLALAAGLFLGAGLALLILFSLGKLDVLKGLFGQQAGDEYGPAPKVGSPAPDFILETLSGENVRLSDLRGKVVLINFWATWCVPCKQEMPMIESRYQQHSSELTVLAIDFAEPVQDVRKFVNDLGLTFDILLDPRAVAQVKYTVHGYPTTYVIDKKGVIQAVRIGEMTEEQLDGYLAKAEVGK